MTDKTFYFISTVDVPSNATKMEALLLNFIRDSHEHAVLEINALDRFVATCLQYQLAQRKANPRLKEVEVGYSSKQYQDNRWLHVGRISITLINVKFMVLD